MKNPNIPITLPAMPPQMKNADVISQLPADNSTPTNNELAIVDTLFKQYGGEMNSMFEESKESLLVGVLFIMFSLTQVNDIIMKFLPMSKKSIYVLLAVKTFFLMIIFWIIKHFYLCRK